jgi:hypothetical protein
MILVVRLGQLTDTGIDLALKWSIINMLAPMYTYWF